VKKLLNVRTANVLKQMEISLFEAGQYSAEHFMRQQNSGIHSLVDLVRACILVGSDPPPGYENWASARAAAEDARQNAGSLSHTVGTEIVEEPAPFDEPEQPAHPEALQMPTALPKFTAAELLVAFEVLVDGLKEPRRQRIVSHRILPGEAMTLSELGKELGVSRERVRQLEENALRKMRRRWKSDKLLVELGKTINDPRRAFDDLVTEIYSALIELAREDTAISLTVALFGVVGNRAVHKMEVAELMRNARAIIFASRIAGVPSKIIGEGHWKQNSVRSGMTFFESLISSTVWSSRGRQESISAVPEKRVRAREIDFEGQESLRGRFESRRSGYGEVHFESELERSILNKIDGMLESVS
jgi:hypothetical protein